MGGARFWSSGESPGGSEILGAWKTIGVSRITVTDEVINVGGSLGAGHRSHLAEFQDSNYRGSRSDPRC